MFVAFGKLTYIPLAGRGDEHAKTVGAITGHTAYFVGRNYRWFVRNRSESRCAGGGFGVGVVRHFGNCFWGRNGPGCHRLGHWFRDNGRVYTLLTRARVNFVGFEPALPNRI